jgi:hypothetical protein
LGEINLYQIVKKTHLTVHPQHKIYGNIHCSAVPQVNFVGNCTIMASIWWTPLSPKSIFTARISWSYYWARRKSGLIISVIQSIAPLTRRLSWYIFWFIIIPYCYYCRRHQCWEFYCNAPQTVRRIRKLTSIQIHKLDDYLDIFHNNRDHVSSFLRPIWV